MDNQLIQDTMLTLNPFHPARAINIYRYGSHVYGTAGPQSDVDVISVANIEEPYVQFHFGEFNCTTFSVVEFEKRLNEHEITMLECISLPDELIVKHTHDYAVDFRVEEYKLRRAVSAKASNSFVKAKKKFTIPEDRNIYVGKKSLFHSLRIPMFGAQIARHGRVVDFSVANHYWPRIRDCETEDWGYYQKMYKPIFNSIMSEFRKVSPKK